MFQVVALSLEGVEHLQQKKGKVKGNSFNGAVERAVRGTIVTQQMKIDTDN